MEKDVFKKLRTMLSEEEKRELVEYIESSDEKGKKWIAAEFEELFILISMLYRYLHIHPDIEKKIIPQMKDSVSKKLALKLFKHLVNEKGSFQNEG